MVLTSARFASTLTEDIASQKIDGEKKFKDRSQGISLFHISSSEMNASNPIVLDKMLLVDGPIYQCGQWCYPKVLLYRQSHCVLVVAPIMDHFGLTG